MTVITADFVLVCNEGFDIIEKGALVFDKTIIDIGTSENLLAKYPQAEHIETAPNSVLLPGLINVHVHLEFSANTTKLHYGSFIPWLQSVIRHREELSALATTELIATKLDAMLTCGTTALGAISSFGADLEACANAPQKVVYFNEILGSVPSAVDAMYGDFRGRFEASRECKNERFIPAVSIHSPYSTHPILAKKALQFAREEGCVISTHFMESQAERAWIDEGSGEFQTFFSAFNPHAKPMSSSMEYLALFDGHSTLFTHGVQATQEELTFMAHNKATLTHCPVSNRLLGVGKLDISAVEASGLPLTLGTDGLSSNISLSLWDEMRSALMMHADADLHALAKTLLKSVTLNASNALKLSCGTLEAMKSADFIIATLPEACALEDVALALILHTHNADMIYIDGEKQC